MTIVNPVTNTFTISYLVVNLRFKSVRGDNIIYRYRQTKKCKDLIKGFYLENMRWIQETSIYEEIVIGIIDL